MKRAIVIVSRVRVRVCVVQRAGLGSTTRYPTSHNP